MSERIIDTNNWFEIKANPLSRVGVFDYMGAQLPGAPDPGKRYKVYRPAEELGAPACLDSFRLVPFIDEHEMLGATEDGLTPAERKGVGGVIGDSVTFDGEYMRGNIKVFSQALANEIRNKKELSLGYRCSYDWTPGVFNGQTYDAIQREIRGNHVALVKRGRMGPDVAVLDRSIYTYDSMEGLTMADTEKTNDGGDQLAEAVAAIEKMAPMMAQFEEMKAKLEALTAAKAADPAAEMSDEDKAKAATATAESGEKMAAMDAEIKRLSAALDAAPKGILTSVQKRDALAAKVQPLIGVFDHACMTADEVAAYAADKLGIKANDVEGYLAGVAAAKPTAAAMDGAPRATGSKLSQYLTGHKE